MMFRTIPSAAIATYGTYYKMAANDRIYSSQSKIAFPAQTQIAVAAFGSRLDGPKMAGQLVGHAVRPHDAGNHPARKVIVKSGLRPLDGMVDIRDLKTVFFELCHPVAFGRIACEIQRVR